MNPQSSFTIVICIILTGLLVNACQSNKKDSRNPYHLEITQTIEEYQQQVSNNPDMQLVDLSQAIKDVALDIRYATTNNFTQQVIYKAPKAFARNPVANALKQIQDSLAHHQLGIKIYDAYRPYAATLLFFQVYPDKTFVADPRHGSRHNRGCAIDLTLINKNTGKEIPMPSEFDDFSEKAHPDYSNLPDTVIKNRALLLGVMSHFGFTNYPSEWWHYDYNGWKNFPLMDLAFNEIELAQKGNNK